MYRQSYKAGKGIALKFCGFRWKDPADLFVFGTSRDDDISIDHAALLVSLGRGDDRFAATEKVKLLDAGSGNDDVTLHEGADVVQLGRGDDRLSANGEIGKVYAGAGDDDITLLEGGGRVSLGRGDDTLTLGEQVDTVLGGRGHDELIFDRDIGSFDIQARHGSITFIDRFSAETTKVKGVEEFTFNDAAYSAAELRATFSADAPTIQVGGGTQTVTVNDPDPTVSVVWDRAAQQAVIDTETAVGPTVASRAYAMTHTAMYDAWSAYDSVAVRVSLDVDGDNDALEAHAVSTAANKEKAMSFAAHTVLKALFPDQQALFDTILSERYGYDLVDDGSTEAAIGIDAAEDLIALRLNDGSNQANSYQGAFTPTNPNPQEINDIAAWTPEFVPIDPDDGSAGQRLQSFLTPQWQDVESFALAENADGSTDHSDVAPPPPRAFFTDAYSGSTLNFDEKTITLSAELSIDGSTYAAGETVDVSKALIGTVIERVFIEQAETVIDYSANLTDKEKVIAEFWEDGGGTAFPPGTFMSFAHFVSARDGHSIDQDAQLFFAMGNAVFDAGIATWNAKVEEDYARPVRLIRDLGELGLIGEEGQDYLGNDGFVISAFAGIDPETGEGLGTRDILATDFTTFQRPGADPSPPFAEYTSGHSAFSAAGAETLLRFTGSDVFGGSVTFAPGSTQFEAGVPSEATTLYWDTFSDAADEAGLSRLFGGIHFEDGDMNGRALGRDVASDVFELTQMFISGVATDEDRPFYDGDAFLS